MNGADTLGPGLLIATLATPLVLLLACLWRRLRDSMPALLVLPPLLAKTVFHKFFVKMGFIRYITMINLLLFMMSLPIKMVLRWSFNLKYIVAIPEYFFNI
jgi:hypothetical protein